MTFLATLVLAELLHSCAPDIGARTMTAVIRVESGGQPLAIHDNTLHRSFTPHDVNQGTAWANQLLALHHSVDLGLSQINNLNLAHLGMSVREAFDPCRNVRGGATILSADYRMASERFGPGQFALRRAIGAYNTGSLFAGSDYVDKILSAAGIAADTDFAVPDLQPISVPAAPMPAPAQRATPAPRPATAAPAPAPIPTADDPFHSPILPGAAPRQPVLLAPPPVSPTPSASPTPVILSPSAPVILAPSAPVILSPARSSIFALPTVVHPTTSPS